MRDGVKFIVVDGMDGSGKTTVVEMVKNLIERTGKQLAVGKGLGSGPLGSVLRQKLFDLPEHKRSTLEVPYLYMSLVDCYESFCEPELADGSIVILDRYTSSFYVYQCYTRGDSLGCMLLSEVLLDDTFMGVKPDLYIYCRVDPETSLERVRARGGENYLDELCVEKSKTVFEGYEAFFANCPYKAKEILNCNNPLESVRRQVINLLDEHDLI